MKKMEMNFRNFFVGGGLRDSNECVTNGTLMVYRDGSISSCCFLKHIIKLEEHCSNSRSYFSKVGG